MVTNRGYINDNDIGNLFENDCQLFKTYRLNKLLKKQMKKWSCVSSCEFFFCLSPVCILFLLLTMSKMFVCKELKIVNAFCTFNRQILVAMEIFNYPSLTTYTVWSIFHIHMHIFVLRLLEFFFLNGNSWLVLNIIMMDLLKFL